MRWDVRFKIRDTKCGIHYALYYEINMDIIPG
jgi:hypothetical protein